MKHVIVMLPVLAIFAAAPAFAAGNACTNAPKSTWKSQATLKKQLQNEGLKVRRIKVEGGCYEVYAVDKHGKHVNTAYNAKTLMKVANAEAGEK